jgi:hypothetical protein
VLSVACSPISYTGKIANDKVTLSSGMLLCTAALQASALNGTCIDTDGGPPCDFSAAITVP